ncbi:MAG: hypothetical protein ABXS91_08525 [Sulfurimonas sp.]
MLYALNVDQLTGKEPEVEVGEEVTLDSMIEGMSQVHMAHNTLMAIAGAVSAVTPGSDATLMDITLDAIGAATAEVTEDGVEPETEFDDEAMAYALDVTMDFAGALGLSQSAIGDLYDEDEEVAMDELQNFASAINSAIHEEGDLASLVTAHIHLDSIVAEFGEDTEEEITLDAVAMDWSFSKKKSRKKAKTGTGHTMKTVECHRTIDGVRKKGFCRYPKSLLKGKYKKARGVSSKQKSHLATMVTDAHTAQSKRRRSQSMKLTREARGSSASKSAKAKM